MAPTDGYDIPGIDLSDDHYTVEQSLVRNKYKALDDTGNVVLRGKQKLFKMKEEFPFTDGEGNDVFTVTASGIIDVAGDYLLSDAQTGATSYSWTTTSPCFEIRGRSATPTPTPNWPRSIPAVR